MRQRYEQPVNKKRRLLVLRMRRGLALVAAALVSALGLAACGGNDWIRVSVVEINADQVCYRSREGSACEPMTDFHANGPVVVGDCFELKLAHPSL